MWLGEQITLRGVETDFINNFSGIVAEFQGL